MRNDKLTKQSSVAIIIINWNSYSLTRDCLESLQKIVYQNFQIVLVDNASSDDSAKKLKDEFPEINLIINSDNLGFTGGNNVGLEFALKNGYNYLLLLNNDTIVEPNFLSILVEKIEEDDNIAAVQPKIYFNHNRQLVWNAGGRYYPVISLSKVIGEEVVDKGQFSDSKESDWLTGCAFMTRSSVVSEVGLLSDLYFYGCFDDVDWSIRMRKKGYKLLFCADSKIYHAVAASSKGDGTNGEGVLKPFFHYLVNRNHILFLRQHTSWFYLPTSYLYQLFKFFGYSAYFIFRRRFRKLRAFLHGFWHGLSKPLDPKSLNHKHYIKLYK